MKKFLVSMMAVITAVLLVACSNASNKDLVHVGVLQYVEHPSLSATRKGFIEELKEEGYVDGKNIKIDYQNAQGDQSNLQTISQSLIEDNDLMLAIATPAAQSLSSLTKDKPILFTAVTDPVSAKLVKSMDNVGGNVTGTSDMSPINKQVELLKKVLPNTKKVGNHVAKNLHTVNLDTISFTHGKVITCRTKGQTNLRIKEDNQHKHYQTNKNQS
jgi:putative tryptophan/tyrosine transport system permease protein